MNIVIVVAIAVIIILASLVINVPDYFESKRRVIGKLKKNDKK